ncbi:MAG: phosphate-starvation-inducible PsiE family protein [Acidimicrobiia bacterium]
MRLESDALDPAFRVVETTIYVVIAVVLTAGSALLLGDAVYRLFTGLGDGIKPAAATTLDALLLTFIFVELLSAVRSTIRVRGLVAEPFLLVGIIASIKEIIVIAGTKENNGDAFTESMIEIGVLGGLALVLALAAFLLRLKESHPEEHEAES